MVGGEPASRHSVYVQLNLSWLAHPTWLGSGQWAKSMLLLPDDECSLTNKVNEGAKIDLTSIRARADRFLVSWWYLNLCFKWNLGGDFLNLPLWANFYNHTDLSHATSTTLDQPILLYDLNPQPSTRLAQQHRLRQVEAEVEAEVEAGWGKLRQVEA